MGLRENMKTEPVTKLALRAPILLGPEEKVRVAIEKMRQQKLGCVIVVDTNNRPLGMFTESMLTQLLARGQNILDDPVRTHMADRVPWVEERAPIADILDVMEVKNVRFLCVVNDEGRVTGLTGQKGLMEYIADHFPGLVMVQRVGCPPSMHREGA